MSIYKNGIWTGSRITNYWLNYVTTPNIIQEPDGSVWLQIFHHNNPADYKFSSEDTFTEGVYKDTNRWFNLNMCDQFTKWELLLKQKITNTDNEVKYRWSQTVNPMIATFNDTVAANTTFITTSGYTTPNVSYGGMYKGSSNSWLVCNNGNDGNWYGAIGCWTAYQSGIPGYNGATISSGFVDVYIRIDNDSLICNSDAQIRNNQELVFNDFIEI
jgi:hypothetical protein